VEIFGREGGDAWYARPAEDFSPTAPTAVILELRDETDILDVWSIREFRIAVLHSGEWPELQRRRRSARRRV
jgi:hypothetical protein